MMDHLAVLDKAVAVVELGTERCSVQLDMVPVEMAVSQEDSA